MPLDGHVCFGDVQFLTQRKVRACDVFVTMVSFFPDLFIQWYSLLF